MNLTNIKYLYDLMDKEKFVFFTVYDSKSSPMRDQCNENYTVEDAKEDLEHFLKYNSGVFRVEFRRTKANHAATKNFSFTIDNIKQDARENVAGIGNVEGGSTDYMSIISSKDDKIEKLQSEMFANMMAAMSKQHEMQMENMKSSLSKDTGNDAIMQTAITAISGMFGGGGNMALSGFDSMEMPTIETTKTNTNKPMIDDSKQKINNAVVRLIRADKGFADNISLLADMAEENPLIYSMAIEKLKSF
jgi:hypothetical protein